MPVGTRLRTNSVFGTVLDNPLTAGALTFNSAGLAAAPIVAGNHYIITLDPLRQFGEPEIVIITSHTSGATIATITRAAFGTTARTHPTGTIWVHAPIVDDVTTITTSAARPADPYRGQMIFETDTNSFVARTALDLWQTVVQFGGWISWTPTLVGLTGGTLTAKYTRVGRTIFYRFKYVMAGAGVGSNPSFTLPVAANAEYVGQDLPVGHASFADFGTATYPGVVILSSTTTAQFQTFNAAGTYAVGNAPSATVPFTWAVSDHVWAWGTYEAVS